MKNRTTRPIPIAEIRIVNPRARNRLTFEIIKANIAAVGLKRPITVHQRAIESDGTRYDLVCGQGRLEAFRELGETMIPAIIKEATEEQQYVMSLVENLARRSPSTIDLLREVKRLTAEHVRPIAIAERLGLDKSYIYGIANLLKHGEDDLIRRVEAGRLPIDTAIKIATGKDAEIQQALSDAYENGSLRGSKLRAVQLLIKQRKGPKSVLPTNRPTTGADLVRAYEHHTQQQRALVRRSTIITQRLAVITSAVRRLLTDEHFITLLRAEDLRSLPEFLSTRIGALSEEPPCQ